LSAPVGFAQTRPGQPQAQGAQKDHNQIGFVCAKYQDGHLVGGPDDMVDDIVL
jgi:hypothetical protein